MSSDWLFLLDSEWSIPPGSNTCTKKNREISDSFVFLRYAHERKAVVGNWGALSAIAEGIMKVSKEVVGEV